MQKAAIGFGAKKEEAARSVPSGSAVSQKNTGETRSFPDTRLAAGLALVRNFFFHRLF
jgi:hypothetical protein